MPPDRAALFNMLVVFQSCQFFTHETWIGLAGVAALIINVNPGSKGTPERIAGVASAGIDVNPLSYESRHGLTKVVTSSIEIVD